jgi:hypothetical protein
MIITKSNVLLGLSPTITTGASTDVAANITDPDFSTSYTSSNSIRLTMDFGAIGPIDHVAVAGHNLVPVPGQKGIQRTRVYDGDEIITTTFIDRNHCTVMTFPERTFTNLRVVLRGEGGNPRVSYVSGGLSFEAPNNGERAGYNRQFLNRNVRSKYTLNMNAAPTASLTKKVVAQGRLNLPNTMKDFSENDWQEFLDFAYSGNYFFIREQENNLELLNGLLEPFNDSAYLCFDPTTNNVNAHSQTRALNDISISFKVFNGL